MRIYLIRKPCQCVEKELFGWNNSYYNVCRAVEAAFVKNSRLFCAICAVALALETRLRTLLKGSQQYMLLNLQIAKNLSKINAKKNITVKDATYAVAESLKD